MARSENLEFITAPLPATDGVPETGAISVSISTHRHEPVPRWHDGCVVEGQAPLMSVKLACAESCRIGGRAALALLVGREHQIPKPIFYWLHEHAGKEKPVYAIDWSTARPEGSSRPCFVSLRHLAETLVGRKVGLHPAPKDSRVLVLLRNRVPVEEGGETAEQEIPDIMIVGALGQEDTDPEDDFLVIVMPDASGVAVPMTLEDVLLRSREVEGVTVPPFVEVGAIQILEAINPVAARRVREAQERNDASEPGTRRHKSRRSKPNEGVTAAAATPPKKRAEATRKRTPKAKKDKTPKPDVAAPPPPPDPPVSDGGSVSASNGKTVLRWCTNEGRCPKYHCVVKGEAGKCAVCDKPLSRPGKATKAWKKAVAALTTN